MIDGLKPYAGYKEANMPWLGKVPDHWTEKRAKYFYREVDERSVTGNEELMSVSHKTGVTPRKAHVTMFMAENNIGHKICRPDDLVINTMWAFMAALGVAKQVGLVSPSYGVYRPILARELHPEYIDRLLRIEDYKSEYLCRSTGIRSSRLRLYPDQFLRIPILCPPPEEQAAIVRFLDYVDRRVRRYLRAKRRLIALLNEQKQAIIHHAVTRGLDPNVTLKPSGVEWLGDVPEHWSVEQLRRLWSVVDCKHLTVPFVEHGIPLASVREVQSFDLELDSSKKTTADWYNHLVSGGRQPKRGDLIYCRNVSVGACAFVNTDEKFAMGQDVCLITSASENQRFLNYLLHSTFMEKQLNRLLVGSTFNRINVAEIKSLLVLVPTREEQNNIVAYLDAELLKVDAPARAVYCEIDLMREYRTRLIADVITGNLDVREAAARLPEDQDEPDTADDLLPADEEVAEDAELDAEPEEVEA